MTATDIDTTARFARQEAILRDEIAELNAALGLAADAPHKVTFGYIGNCDTNGIRDHRSWFVFLPHPGRIGTDADSIGGFGTGDLNGIVAARRALRAVTQGVRLARSI